MTLSELISELSRMKRQHGDVRILLDVWCHGLLAVQEVGFVEEDNSVVMWGTPVEPEEEVL